MLESLNDTIRRHLADNIWIYIIVVFMFILGITMGALTVNGVDAVSKSDARTYIEGFLHLTQKNELKSASILKQSIRFNLYFALILFLSGLIYPGILIIPLIIAFRGFCIGFTVAFLTESFGGGGFLLSVGSVLPQSLIYVPVTIVMGVIGLNYSIWVLRSRYFKRYGAAQNTFATYAFSVLILFILLAAGCIIEAYLTTIVVKAITPYVLK